MCVPILSIAALLVLGQLAAAAQDGAGAPRGRFGLSRIDTRSGELASPADFALSQECALCHQRQWEELRGSMHSVSHEDPLYRSFAELARAEAGEDVYTYCSGCHSPAGVVTGAIPGLHESRLPPQAKAGVTCDVCHQVAALNGQEGPWGEPGNASLVLDPGRVKYGAYSEIATNPAHTGARADFLSSSEFCASCHSVIHPYNGLRIEHTYEEWRNSVYAEKGIQCQDCHMRSVEDAVQVARSLTPVSVRGSLVRGGEERERWPHYFVGGNVDARRLGGGGRHAFMATRRLQTAAKLEIETVGPARAGSELALGLVVTNETAGHNLPTSLTELREMWIHVRVLDAHGALVYESGALDEHGEIVPGAIRFGTGLVDAEGRPTFRPWEAVEFGWRRVVPPKGSVRELLGFPLPGELAGPLAVQARLLYRIAAPHVLHEVMGDKAFAPEVVEMATADAEVVLAP